MKTLILMTFVLTALGCSPGGSGGRKTPIESPPMAACEKADWSSFKKAYDFANENMESLLQKESEMILTEEHQWAQWALASAFAMGTAKTNFELIDVLLFMNARINLKTLRSNSIYEFEKHIQKLCVK